MSAVHSLTWLTGRHNEEAANLAALDACQARREGYSAGRETRAEFAHYLRTCVFISVGYRLEGTRAKPVSVVLFS